MEVEKSKSRHENREISPAREYRDGRRKEKDRRSKDKDKEHDRDKNRDKEHEREKDQRRYKEKERERKRDKEGDTEKEISRGRDKEREKEKSKEKEKLKEKSKEKEKEAYKDKDRSRVKDRASKKSHEDDGETEKAHEAPEEVKEEQPDGWTQVKDDTDMDAAEVSSDTKEIDESIHHEVAVGKGLSGALKLLKDRGTLKEKVEWSGRNMDKKKSKLVGIVDDEERFKDIRIERTDEFGRTLTQKEAFRSLSHKFHGKGPGKRKQEKRMKQYQQELKLKQMENSDTPSLSVQRMREAQAQFKTPYLVLSGNAKPGQTSDPQSGFATVEKDVPGSLTAMLGDKKMEHFLGIKRKSEPRNSSTPPKRPKH